MGIENCRTLYSLSTVHWKSLSIIVQFFSAYKESFILRIYWSNKLSIWNFLSHLIFHELIQSAVETTKNSNTGTAKTSITIYQVIRTQCDDSGVTAQQNQIKLNSS